MNKINGSFFASRSTQRGRLIVWGVIGFIVVLLMANLGSIVDVILHPEIEYFDKEHILVGMSSALIVGIMMVVIVVYIERIEKVLRDNKQAEETLRRSEEDLRAAQRLANVGSWKWDIAANTVHWSKELRHINEYDPDLPPPNFAEMSSFYTSESWKRLNEVVAKAVNTGEAYELELELVRTDGIVRYTIARGEVAYDASGKIVGLHGTVQDITERKHVEERLRESEEKFRALFESAKDGIFLLSEAGDVVALNASFARLHGYTVEEALNLNLKDLDTPESAQLSPARLPRVLAGESLLFEVEHYCKNGQRIPLEVSANRVVVGGETYIIGFHRDITDRKRAEEELLKLKLGIERSADAVFITDTQGVIIYTNPSFEEIYGYTQSDAIGHTPRILKSGVVPLEQYQRFWATLLNKDSIAGEIINKTKDGRLLTIEGSNTPILDAAGNIIGFLGVHRDITERKQAEAEINRMALALDIAPNAITVHDFDGRFLYANQRAFDLHGYSRDEFMKLTLRELDTPTSTQLIVSRMQELHERGEADFQAEHFRKDGTILPMEIRARVTTWGDAQAILSIATDITERKQREHELQAIATLSAALRTAPSRAEMLPVIVGQLSHLLNCEVISIEIIHPVTGEAIVEAAYGAWQAIVGSRQKDGTGLNAIISQTRQPYYTNNLADETNLAYPKWANHGGIQSSAGVPLIAQDQLIGFLWMGRKKEITESEVRLLTATADIAANAIHRASLHELTQKDATDLRLAYDTTLEGWVQALELRDQETEGHSHRVVQLTVELARALGIGAAELEHVRRGALLHDIGKMGIPDSVLLKPGTLNDREWEIMKRHPEYAFKFLELIEYLHPAIDIPYCHHEKWDGSGYPRGLKGEEIPLVARIFAIVDVWDALRSDRPYRKAWDTEQALKHIQEQAGKHFDPAVVKIFLEDMAGHVSV